MIAIQAKVGGTKALNPALSGTARRFLAAALATAAHAAALVLFMLSFPALGLPESWRGQFVFLLLLSLTFAWLLPLARAGTVFILLCLRAGLMFLLCHPMGGRLHVEGALAASLIIEANLHAGFYGGALFAPALIALSLGLKRAVPVWDTVVPAPAPLDLAAFGFFAVSVMAAGIVLRRQQDGLRRAAEANRRLDASLQPLVRANMRLQEYAAAAGREAAANERKRLAREMHDTTAYSLTNLVMMLEAAMDLAPGGPEELHRHLERARDQAKAGLLEVRRALQALRLAERAQPAGLGALRNLVETFEMAAQIQVLFTIYDGVPTTLGEEADLAIYRLVQEGLTNAMRHGRATRVQISIARVGQVVSVQIKDNGVGASGFREGYGLTGMRERIGHLGGQIQIFSEPGVGFLLSARIPCEEESAVGKDPVDPRG